MSREARFWNARWIHPSPDPRHDIGAFVLRRKLELRAKPEKLVVKVSADQRYRLYVNGEQVSFGPARSDLWHWNFEEVDIAAHLQEGENLVHAVVWSFGHMAPMAQHTFRTGFILEGEGLSTPEHWEMATIPGYDFGNLQDHLNSTYYVSGPGEVIDGAKIPAWSKLAHADLEWVAPRSYWMGFPGISGIKGPVIGGAGKQEGSGIGDSSMLLTKRQIPPMLYKTWKGAPKVVNRETDERTPLRTLSLKPGEEVLLDWEELLCAFPVIKAKGKGRLTVRYAEAMVEGKGPHKGNRNVTKGKNFSGVEDWFQLADTAAEFEPLWWRCFRYMLLVSDSGAEVELVQAKETGYPLLDEADWESDGSRHKEIYQVALRTARRCAGETYFDCPYYEQLQYVGDSRIQAQIGRFFSRDRRLQKQCIDAYAHSVIGSGLTQSRYPSRELQVIPGFSLWWIHMLWDQHMYDPDGVNPDHLGIAQGILDWWEWAITEAPDMTYWAYSDWVPDGHKGWGAGVPPNGLRSVVQTSHLLYTQIIFGKLMDDDGLLDACRARLIDFEEKPDGTIIDRTYDPEAGATEHAATLVRLCHKELGLPVAPWPKAMPADSAKTSLFYSMYQHQAREAEDYEPMLDEWRKQISDGLTTFLEIPDPSRSDCHAWSAHPVLGFFQRLAGIASSAPAWGSVHVKPNPGSIKRFSARVPHPKGDLKVSLKDGKITVESPVPYKLEWQGKVTEG